MACRIIDTKDIAWTKILADTNYDIYQLPCFNQIESEILAGEAKAFYYEHEKKSALIPVIKRRIPFTINGKPAFDAVSPYGYPGILISENFSQENLSFMFNEIQMCGLKNDLISTFLRLHPIMNGLSIESSECILFMNIGQSIAIDCSNDFEKIVNEFSSNHKKNIRKLLKDGVYYEVDNWIDYNRFQYLYSDTMRRVSANQYYFYDRRYFEDLQQCLNNKLHLITVKNKNREILAAGIFSSINNFAQSILTSTNFNFIKLAPSKLLFYGMIKWCNENGVKLLNLGGGVGSQKDSLYNFKLGFGKEIYPFNGIGIIHNPKIYKELELKCKDKKNSSNYFPCYRSEQEN